MHKALLNQLTTRWSGEGVRVGAGTALIQIQQFERLHNVQLPDDFKAYVLLVNGMVPGRPHATDQRGFFFWPLTQMRSAYDELAANQTRESELPAEPLKDYLVFADYLHWSWAYALNVSTGSPSHGEILKVDEPTRFGGLTENFCEFLKLYLEDSPLLYEPVKPLP